MLLQRQEIAPAALPLQRVHGLGHLRIAQVPEIEGAPSQLHVGDGLDVEHQAIHRRLALLRGTRPAPLRAALRFAGPAGAAGAAISTATATTRPASSVSVTCPAPIPSLRRRRSPRAE